MKSLDHILPFLGPVKDLFADRDLTEVMINHGGRDIYVERHGIVHLMPGVHIDPVYLDAACKLVARACGTDVSASRPILYARLSDGSRVAALLHPCSVDGTTLTIRRFPRALSWRDLCDDGTIPREAQVIMIVAVLARQNILIAGETDAGKTTVLTALASLFPDESRVIIIEETAEIVLDKPHVIRFETRPARPPIGTSDPAVPAVTIADLVRASLRHRPDRLVLGEIRGPEAADLLELLNTGHAGSLTTIHANSAELALSRLARCVHKGMPEMPYQSIREDVAETIHLVVHMVRRNGVRTVAEILSVDGYQLDGNRFLTTRQFPSRTTSERHPTGLLGAGTRAYSRAG